MDELLQIADEGVSLAKYHIGLSDDGHLCGAVGCLAEAVDALRYAVAKHLYADEQARAAGAKE